MIVRSLIKWYYTAREVAGSATHTHTHSLSLSGASNNFQTTIVQNVCNRKLSKCQQEGKQNFTCTKDKLRIAVEKYEN